MHVNSIQPTVSVTLGNPLPGQPNGYIVEVDQKTYPPECYAVKTIEEVIGLLRGAFGLPPP